MQCIGGAIDVLLESFAKKRSLSVGDRGQSDCCPCGADYNFTCICTSEERRLHNVKRLKEQYALFERERIADRIEQLDAALEEEEIERHYDELNMKDGDTPPNPWLKD